MNYLIANWKSHKTLSEATDWVRDFSDYFTSHPSLGKKCQSGQLTIIVCPPYPLLTTVKRIERIEGCFIGSQDVSSFPSGSFTGEVNTQLLKDLVRYTLIGHSERVLYCHESTSSIKAKYALCSESGITPILCVRNPSDMHDLAPPIVAYEPTASIGTGDNASVETVKTMRQKLSLPHSTHFLYGGSVTPDNAHGYIQENACDGFLIGGASLNAASFLRIAELL